ncbi:hypothetical protein C8R47DRAFT_1243819 [Mycena vitilis]|nr:hypothetical protein C8R47DRAFT_1243819 [Mycena vitilis]
MTWKVLGMVLSLKLDMAAPELAAHAAHIENAAQLEVKPQKHRMLFLSTLAAEMEASHCVFDSLIRLRLRGEEKRTRTDNAGWKDILHLEGEFESVAGKVKALRDAKLAPVLAAPESVAHVEHNLGDAVCMCGHWFASSTADTGIKSSDVNEPTQSSNESMALVRSGTYLFGKDGLEQEEQDSEHGKRRFNYVLGHVWVYIEHPEAQKSSGLAMTRHSFGGSELTAHSRYFETSSAGKKENKGVAAEMEATTLWSQTRHPEVIMIVIDPGTQKRRMTRAWTSSLRMNRKRESRLEKGDGVKRVQREWKRCCLYAHGPAEQLTRKVENDVLGYVWIFVHPASAQAWDDEASRHLGGRPGHSPDVQMSAGNEGHGVPREQERRT